MFTTLYSEAGVPSKPVSFGTLKFTAKKDALAFLKSMLHKYSVGDRVNEKDSVILLAALANHPESQKKIGLGVKEFKVKSADFNSRCFWVVRIDDSEEKFSYSSCVNG